MTSDIFKGGVHFAAGALAATMGLYNLLEACGTHRRRRHRVNAAIYLAATLWEGWNTYDHWHRS